MSQKHPRQLDYATPGAYRQPKQSAFLRSLVGVASFLLIIVVLFVGTIIIWVIADKYWPPLSIASSLLVIPGALFLAFAVGGFWQKMRARKIQAASAARAPSIK